MVHITEELIRKRAEHNELMISTLEELSLHQLDIERIEHVDRWCRDLKILYLQYNLIPRIEHVSRLKELDYLNLALNNIEIIEGLEGCEKLRKLDLTANFVGAISSCERLQANHALRELYLTGNPCTEFQGYRAYVIAALPQLGMLDGEAITYTERLRSIQQYETLTFRAEISRQERQYEEVRSKQKREFLNQTARPTECTVTEITDEEAATTEASDEHNIDLNQSDKRSLLTEADVWAKKEPFSPESRLSTYKTLERVRAQKENSENSKKTLTAEVDEQCGGNKSTRKRTYFNKETGEPLNVNEAKLEFRLEDGDGSGSNCLILRVPVYKYMDSSLIHADVQPNYVRVTIKGKVLQLVLPENVRTSESKAHRSVFTGELTLTMPKVQERLRKTRSTTVALPRKENSTGNAQAVGNNQLDSKAAPDRTLLDLEGTGFAMPATIKQQSLAAKLKISEVANVQQSRLPPKPGKQTKSLVSELGDREFRGDTSLAINDDCSNSHDIRASSNFVDDDAVPPLETAY